MADLHSSPHTHLSRRNFTLSLVALSTALAGQSKTALAVSPDVRVIEAPPRLILLELQGGNDALNTLVPHRDPLYARYRPTIGLGATDLIRLDDDVSLNNALSGFHEICMRGGGAIVQDVGYPGPNLSHFESAAIWASADPKAIHGDGWAGRVLGANPGLGRGLAVDADGIVLGGEADFLAAKNVHVLALEDPLTLLTSHPPHPDAPPQSNSASQHLHNIVVDQAIISERVARKIKPPNRFNALLERDHYMDPFEAQVALALWMIDSGVYAPALKLSLSGFDMHSNLRGQHEAILGRLSRCMLVLERGLKDIGVWQDVLILATSEFGRRPAENASGGTDHGSAGPVFLLGGGVRAGVYGQRAPLERLDADGNVLFQIDFRDILATIVSRFWNIDPGILGEMRHPTLGFI